MKYPLFPVALALAVGICLDRLSPWRPNEALLLLGSFCILAGFAVWKARRLVWPAVLLSVSAAGICLAIFHRTPKAPSLDAGPEETVALEGCVVSPPIFSDNHDQFLLQLAPNARARVSLTIREGEPLPDLNYGQRVEVEGRVRKPRNFENPGAFDYRVFLAKDHIYWTVAMHAGSIPKILPGSCGWKLLAWIYHLRVAAGKRLDEIYRDRPLARTLLHAILLGERQQVSPALQEDFRKAGTYHVLVIAGLHLATFTAFLLFLLRICFLREIPALAITAAAAWLYAILSGGSTPVLRAASGFTLYLVARYFSRKGRVLNLLAAVAIVFLIWDPEQLFDPSFQLSFLSVLAIAAIGGQIIELTSGSFRSGLRNITEKSRDPRLEPRVAQLRVEVRLIAETISLRFRLPAKLLERFVAGIFRMGLTVWELAVISTAIQIGVALPMALYFHRVSLAGISANVLVVPLMALVVPAGLLAVITGWHPIAASAAWLVETAAGMSVWHARTAPDWRIPDPPFWLSLLFVTSLVVLAILLERHASAWSAFAITVVLVLFGLLIWHPFQPAAETGRLEVTTMDVGQGDSLMVAFPDRRLMVVDGGGIPTFRGMSKSKLDIGEEVVAPYLWYRSIRSLDILALTHAHADHAGGIPALIEDFRPKELWAGANSENPAWDAIRNQARRFGVKIVSLRAGQSFSIGGALVSVLAPAADYLPGDQPKNDDSLVLRVQHKERSFLLTGDAERFSESRILAEKGNVAADVLKVGHHGSRTSSSEEFLQAVKPTFAVISDGAGNLFHHPHPDVLQRLQDHHVEVLRTDRKGLIRFSTDGHRIWLETFEP